MPSTLTWQPRKCQLATGSILRVALRSAMDATEACLEDAAKWCGVSVATIKRWLRGERPVAVEKVLRSQRLGPVFLSHLVLLNAAKPERDEPVAVELSGGE